MKVHPKTWWFRLAEKICPGRCREIPEATEPGRILIRQVALVMRYVYLQQFASAENPRFYHTHPWSWGTLAIGLWGSVGEVRYTGVRKWREYAAPYFRYMGPSFCHRTYPLGPGHTSLFIGLGRKTDDKWYLPSPEETHWTEHIQKKVKRI